MRLAAHADAEHPLLEDVVYVGPAGCHRIRYLLDGECRPARIVYAEPWSRARAARALRRERAAAGALATPRELRCLLGPFKELLC